MNAKDSKFIKDIAARPSRGRISGFRINGRRVQIYLTKQEEARLSRISMREGRSMSFILANPES